MIVACFDVVVAQQNNLDSLELEVRKLPDDTNKVKALSDLAFDFSFKDANKAEAIGKEALVLATRLHFPAGMAGANRNIGLALARKSDATHALEFLFTGLKQYAALNHTIGKAKTLMSIGGIFSDQGDLNQAEKYFLEALDLFTRLNNNAAIAKVYNNLGIVYNRRHESDRAIAVYKKALAINDSLNNAQAREGNLSNLGSIFMETARFDEAKSHLLMALTINKETGNELFRATHYGNLGDTWYRIYQSGKKTNLTDLKVAERYVDSSITLFQKLNDRASRHGYHKLMANIQEKLGNKEKALMHLNEYVILKDSLFNSQKASELAELRLQYDFDKREAILKSNQDRERLLNLEQARRHRLVRNTLMIGFVLALLIAVVFWNQRNRIKKERNRSDSLLLNILPASVADELKQQGTTQARHFNEASVLFTDFAGFTQLSETLTPSELVEELNVCFGAFDSMVLKYQLEKIKTIGDSYMCATGITEDTKGNPVALIDAALDMLSFIQEEKSRRDTQSKISFQMRAGIHTGPITAGVVGTIKFQYDIWGDTVNTASRIESASQTGKLSVSENTYLLVCNEKRFRFQERGYIEVKGKKPIRMYFVERA